MTEINASAIEYVDVVVIGGGIAGVAIAEYLARHSSLSIKVLERSPQLGTGSSGKLEGWFHTGALYSGQDDGQTFLNCVNGVEDLINLYSPYFDDRCNLDLEEVQSGCYRPAIASNPNGWFSPNPVYVIHPKARSPEIQLSGLKSDAVQTELQLKRVLGRLEMAYGQQHNWLQNGRCLAPSYAQLEAHEGLDCSLLASTELIDSLCRRFDESYQLTETDYEIARTLDCSMQTDAILRDLVASAIANGVRFETGVELEGMQCDRYGQLKVKNLCYRTPIKFPRHLKAQLFVFAVGEGFESILPQLQVRARLKRSRSAMIVAQPALIETNFVRMSPKNRFHFNHFIQKRSPSDPNQIYSMLANSGYANGDSTESVDIEPILESAERYFGKDKLYSRQLFSYECTKTEFVSDDEQKRRYSYWIEYDPQSNYLCVLPGKFSFFPTVAFQAYQRIKTLIPLAEKPMRSPFIPDPQILQQAKELVAEPYPAQILARSVAMG
jgi:hypothetical protein